MSTTDLVEHVDAPDPDELQMGITRREIAKAEAAQKEQEIALLTGKKPPTHKK
jgi:hypothetical protein